MLLHPSVATTTATPRASRRNLPSRTLLLSALDAAGAIPCRVFADDFSFAAVDDSIHDATGIAASAWAEEAFWERYLHCDDRMLVDDARRAARMGWRNVTVAFRIVQGTSWVAMRLVGHRSADRSEGRSVLDGYLVVASLTDGAVASTAATAGALQQARRDLARTSQLALAGALVAAITHDLRQPLTALQVNIEVATQLLRSTPQELPVALEALDDATRDGRKLRDSLQVLHNLVGHREPAFSEFSVDAIVAEVAHLVQPEADARHVRLVVVGDAELLRLRGDATMFREVVLSVVLDAVENATSDAGAAVVHVQTRAANDRIELSVTHRRRAESSDDDAWALRVARSVADAHGGAVRVERAADEMAVHTIWPAIDDGTQRAAGAA
jgi:signal transduction histidine kinase